MSKTSKRKGDRFERDVVNFLQGHGFPTASRNGLTGQTEDIGDVLGVPGWTFEIKNHRNLADALRMSVDEGKIEARHGGNRWFAGIVKRSQRPTHEAYFVMPLWLAVELIKEAQGETQ